MFLGVVVPDVCEDVGVIPEGLGPVHAYGLHKPAVLAVRVLLELLGLLDAHYLVLHGKPFLLVLRAFLVGAAI